MMKALGKKQPETLPDGTPVTRIRPDPNVLPAGGLTGGPQLIDINQLLPEAPAPIQPPVQDLGLPTEPENIMTVTGERPQGPKTLTPQQPQSVELPEVVMPGTTTPNMDKPLGEGGIGHDRSFLDVVAGLVVGNTPESQLSPEARGRKQQRRAEASQLATSAANNPGDAFMEIPVAGGDSDLMSNIGTLMRLAAGWA